jgi:hypothetical protein
VTSTVLLSGSPSPTRAGNATLLLEASNVIGRLNVGQRRLGRDLGARGSSHRSSRPAVLLQTRCTSHGVDDVNS